MNFREAKLYLWPSCMCCFKYRFIFPSGRKYNTACFISFWFFVFNKCFLGGINVVFWKLLNIFSLKNCKKKKRLGIVSFVVVKLFPSKSQDNVGLLFLQLPPQLSPILILKPCFFFLWKKGNVRKTTTLNVKRSMTVNLVHCQWKFPQKLCKMNVKEGFKFFDHQFYLRKIDSLQLWPSLIG